MGLHDRSCHSGGPESSPPHQEGMAVVKDSASLVWRSDGEGTSREPGSAALASRSSVTASKRKSRGPLLSKTWASHSAPADLGPSTVAAPTGPGGDRDPGASSDEETDTVNSKSMPPPPSRPARFSAGAISNVPPKAYGKPAVPAHFSGGYQPPVASGCHAVPSQDCGVADRHPPMSGLARIPQQLTHLERPQAVSRGSVKAPCLASRPQGPKGDLRRAVLLKNGIAERPAKGPTVTEVGLRNLALGHSVFKWCSCVASIPFAEPHCRHIPSASRYCCISLGSCYCV